MLLSEDGAGLGLPLPKLHSTEGLTGETAKSYSASELFLTRAGNPPVFMFPSID